MSTVFTLAGPSSSSLKTALVGSSRPHAFQQVRSVSSSPYGRTHVWKHRQRVLPKPFAPQFPQVVVRVDGSTFTHYTTSPRSVLKLSKDTTNTPLWNASRFLGEAEEEDAITGRLGRFNRRFEGLGGYGAQNMTWMAQSDAVEEGRSLKDMKADAESVMGVYKKKDKKK
ncbi:uncharacterized protein B0H18DRAFT_879422 [Fomitopsis serialis]|uniref:uncharacterized protein n=1 Tax=Fomitopsis serialis TaxID=139415 RepID=UPI0020078FB5|nr:uncharacterized protein B0H18DRAFT_879422 [Neoantrodia serialis]KAH9922407.1 hypothetical protein B0H18DRAFT_879422 [Neoantrodia serialis]